MNNNYLAGFFDGEGSISIIYYNKRNINEFYILIQISNTNLDILKEFQKRFSGKIYPLKIKSENHTQAYSWKITAIVASLFLKNMLPYLVIKKSQAELALKFQQRQFKGKFINNNEMDLRLKMRNEMLELNGRHLERRIATLSQ